MPTEVEASPENNHETPRLHFIALGVTVLYTFRLSYRNINGGCARRNLQTQNSQPSSYVCKTDFLRFVKFEYCLTIRRKKGER